MAGCLQAPTQLQPQPQPLSCPLPGATWRQGKRSRSPGAAAATALLEAVLAGPGGARCKSVYLGGGVHMDAALPPLWVEGLDGVQFFGGCCGPDEGAWQAVFCLPLPHSLQKL